MDDRPNGAVIKVAILAAVIGVTLLVGSVVYWVAEGSPGTPGQFRQSVEDTGLQVEWDRFGPRSGSGVVTTECGPVAIEVNHIDGALFADWNRHRERLTPAAVAAIVSCAR